MDTAQQQSPDPSQPQVFSAQQPGKKRWLILIAIVLVLLLAGGIFRWMNRDQQKETTKQTNTTTTPVPGRSTETPQLAVETVLEQREHVWDIAFLPTKEMIITERKGTVSIVEDGKARALADIGDVYARGEGGLMGLVVDPQFADNKYIYTCYNSTKDDIRVVRWRINEDMSALGLRKDIVTGMPQNPSGRHSGCRLAFGLDGYLWVGTGDTAQNLTPQSPQDPKSLAGKILRVDRDGKAAPGNLGGMFDARIYSYGHRNTQGLAFFAKEINGVSGISAEHGSSVDDEVNLLKPGNFGWAPPDGPYDESIPMTDKDHFPDAVEAIWSSGDPTLAPSGAAVLKGSQWKAWDGAVAVAMLKTQHVRILLLDAKLKVTKEETRLADEYGRLRAVTQGPDGSLYVSTSNGSNDKVIRLTPQ